MEDFALLKRGIKVENNYRYSTVMAVLIMIMTFLRLFEHAVIVVLFCIYCQLVILNSKIK